MRIARPVFCVRTLAVGPLGVSLASSSLVKGMMDSTEPTNFSRAMHVWLFAPVNIVGSTNWTPVHCGAVGTLSAGHAGGAFGVRYGEVV